MPKSGELDINYPKLLETKNKIKLLEPYKGSKKHHKMQCMECNYIWTATPKSKTQTLNKHKVSGCPNCNNIKKEKEYLKTREKNKQDLKERNITILDKSYDGRRHLKNERKILVRNENCGHEFKSTPSNLLSRNVTCPICAKKLKSDTLTAWSKSNSMKFRETAPEWVVYRSKVYSLTAVNYRKHKKLINPDDLIRDKAGVDGAHHLDHIVSIKYCFDHNIPAEVCSHVSNLRMMGWRENISKRDRLKDYIPNIFINYINTNTRITRIASSIRPLFPNARMFYKDIGGDVASLYDEELKLAIFIHPIDDTHKNNRIAYRLRKYCKQNGIRLFVIYEDEWEDNSTLVISKLKHYTNQNESKTIYARKCDIKEVSALDKGVFLNSYHIQGNDNSKIYLGAYYDNILVALMTFTPPRIGIGKHTEIEDRWELCRFCTHTDYRIVGIASKLLSHFKRNNSWKEIYSYADKRWSDGNLYYQLGFQLTTDNPPDYFYIIEGKRRHRWNYRKDILKNKFQDYDPNLTEYQNMENHGYYRIWDCGTLRFSMKNK